ncbi:uncharacterized protein LOC142975739 isoform X5 [Anticarsia gemmatalis]|uniref:uncharacterized protein LOC142975739 isoform X5 n=1 Tax=Anticarsia gemmatalis TaxID=129554 RepID=UPI003F764212
MGAKQSKRSVDISGKEAESAGEVAAAIAGGEGRVEQLADADALKPQLNGDAHIHETTEEKQKDIDSGTPENEKDATTEKEAKQQEEEKDAAPLTNGDSEQKVENGESTPTPEDSKKPKKEKTAEVAPEAPAVTDTAEEAKTPNEVKEDKTPETPVTEPITNGSSTPESPKAETPVVEEAAAPSPEVERPEPIAETEPEKLPVNGLSLDEPAKETTENEKNEDSKEESVAETPEIVPEISVKKEEPLPVSDKLADLIPEVPEVPELKTDMLQETTSDVAVAN